jgi:CRISPR-associated exonuclease Cas4
VLREAMYTEDDLLPISALQHLLFCERQCALIHVEQVWADNRLTVEGNLLHQKAHDGPDESRPGVRIVRGLELRSLRLGLTGRADVVEFHDIAAPDGGRTRLVQPVEYKRGRAKRDDCDRVQLCAQAMCLEEMLHVDVPRGALFYGRPRRREVVNIDARLRDLTEQTAARLHKLIHKCQTPTVRQQPKCKRCSLLHACMPGATGPRRSIADYMQRALTRAANPNGGLDE